MDYKQGVLRSDLRPATCLVRSHRRTTALSIPHFLMGADNCFCPVPAAGDGGSSACTHCSCLIA